MKILRNVAAAIALTSGLGFAQTPDGPVPSIDIVKRLKIDAKRASLVRSILDTAVKRATVAQQQLGGGTDAMTVTVAQIALQAICEDADRQLAAVLTPEEYAAFMDALEPSTDGLVLSRTRL